MSFLQSKVELIFPKVDQEVAASSYASLDHLTQMALTMAKLQIQIGVDVQPLLDRSVDSSL
eukprot:12763153-Prorocentrum_lima.AAC.1